MGSDDRVERIQRDLEQVLRFITEEGGAGGMVGPEGFVVGISNWEERTKDQRFSERVKTHGYPLGFAKSQYHVRDGLVETQRSRVEAADREDQVAFADAREAVAWALDAERFLGSFHHGAAGNFPVEAVDQVADQILAWLDHRGYRVVPKEGGPATEETELDEGPNEGGETTMDSIGSGDAEKEQEEEDEEEAVDDEEQEDDGEEVDCPYCDGTGVAGGVGSSGLCPACAGSGTMSVDDAEDFDEENFEWKWTDIYHFKSDMLLEGIPASLFRSTDYDPRSEAGPGVDWSGLAFDDVDLHGVDLSKADLHGCGFSGSDLSHTNLSGANLANAGFSHLAGANLSGADLTGADLQGADLRGANLTDANLRNADLRYAHLSESLLVRTNLTGVLLEEANLSGADLTGTPMEVVASLQDTILKDVVGLSEETLAACLEGGAVLEVDEPHES